MDSLLITAIPPETALPFALYYCNQFNTPFDNEQEERYGNGVLWMGAMYRQYYRAVCGLFASDELPGELLIYGFYGDGSTYQYRPLRALIVFINSLPYNNKYGYVLADNRKMLHILDKYGWDVRSRHSDPLTNRETVKVGRYG